MALNDSGCPLNGEIHFPLDVTSKHPLDGDSSTLLHLMLESNLPSNPSTSEAALNQESSTFQRQEYLPLVSFQDIGSKSCLNHSSTVTQRSVAQPSPAPSVVSTNSGGCLVAKGQVMPHLPPSESCLQLYASTPLLQVVPVKSSPG